MKPEFTRLLRRRACLLALAALPLLASAQSQSAIKIIVGAAPGGSTDIVARILAADLTKRLGQQFPCVQRQWRRHPCG